MSKIQILVRFLSSWNVNLISSPHLLAVNIFQNLCHLKILGFWMDTNYIFGTPGVPTASLKTGMV